MMTLLLLQELESDLTNLSSVAAELYWVADKVCLADSQALELVETLPSVEIVVGS